MDDLRVIYEDDDLIVVDKPSGLRTQPGLENGPRRGEWTDEDRDSAYGRWHGGSKQSRHEFWQAAVDGMYAKLREDGSASHLEDCFRRLENHKTTIPRKRRTFIALMVRTIDATENQAAEMYDLVCKNITTEAGPPGDSVMTRVQAVHPSAHIVHRLDQETSGILLLAKSYEICVKLSASFRDRKVHKEYTAVLEGHLAQHSGEITTKIRPDCSNRPYQVIDEINGKETVTQYKVIARDDCCHGHDDGTAMPTTCVCFHPVTGRTHQLRMHALAIGHPILGDTLYGTWSGMADRLLLHASLLRLQHPSTGQEMTFTSPAQFC